MSKCIDERYSAMWKPSLFHVLVFLQYKFCT